MKRIKKRKSEALFIKNKLTDKNPESMGTIMGEWFNKKENVEIKKLETIKLESPSDGVLVITMCDFRQCSKKFIILS